MNWGYKIALVIVAFIVIMLSMVYVSFKQSNEMMDKNYYQKELRYQSYIDASNNLDSISTDLLLKQLNNQIIVQIPKILVSNFDKGNIEFLRNDDQRKDVNVNFTPDTAGMFTIDKSKFSYGNYNARIQWHSNNRMFYREQNIMIQ